MVLVEALLLTRSYQHFWVSRGLCLPLPAMALVVLSGGVPTPSLCLLALPLLALPGAHRRRQFVARVSVSWRIVTNRSVSSIAPVSV